MSILIIYQSHHYEFSAKVSTFLKVHSAVLCRNFHPVMNITDERFGGTWGISKFRGSTKNVLVFIGKMRQERY